MSEPIKVGDLVIVLRGCCVDQSVGKVRVVSYIGRSHGNCQKCGADHVGVLAAILDGINLETFRLEWLKRINPLGELDDVKREEEIHA